MKIDVSKMTRYVGKMTLDNIEAKLKDMYREGISGVDVDVTGLPLRMDFVVDIARLEDTYGCNFIGLGEKEEQVSAILGTGYFVKESLGKVGYGKSFRRAVEMADFPLMIKDNRRLGDELIIYNVIQPVRFDENYFYYNVIKPYLLEPGELERACWHGDGDIWDKASTHITDIGRYESGFRFANTEQERTILDIFTKVIDGVETGFYDAETLKEE